LFEPVLQRKTANISGLRQRQIKSPRERARSGHALAPRGVPARALGPAARSGARGRRECVVW